MVTFDRYQIRFTSEENKNIADTLEVIHSKSQGFIKKDDRI